MKTLRLIIAGILAFFTLGLGSALAGPPDGFQFIQEWGGLCSRRRCLLARGSRLELKDGTWVKLQAGSWVPDAHPPAVIMSIPKDQAHCPPGLAKKGCAAPGQRKKWVLPAIVRSGSRVYTTECPQARCRIPLSATNKSAWGKHHVAASSRLPSLG